jgi:hypothetical protein
MHGSFVRNADWGHCSISLMTALNDQSHLKITFVRSVMRYDCDNSMYLNKSHFSDQPGHFVRDCPTKDAKGDTGGRKPKPGYVCRACGSDGHYLEDCLVANQRPPQSERRGGKRGPLKEISSGLFPSQFFLPLIFCAPIADECWFCLSNPNLAYVAIVPCSENRQY